MSFSCLRSVSPNISSVDVLYDDNSAEGHLYSGSGAPPLCSSTSPPPSSGCVVCFDRFIHTVCSNLLRNATLVMEGDGKPIDLMKSARCPRLFGDDAKENAGWFGNHGSAWKGWLPVILLFLIITTVLLVVFCKRRKCQTTPKNLERNLNEQLVDL